MIVNSSGYIISVRHGLEAENNRNIKAHILDHPKPFDLEIICISSGEYDLSLLRIKERL